MKKKLILATLVFFISASGLTYAAGNSNAVDSIINKNPLVANYVHELLNSLQSLMTSNVQQQETIENLTKSNADKDVTITKQNTTIEQLQTEIRDLNAMNEDQLKQIQYIEIAAGIVEGSTFGYLKNYLTSKEVTFSNNNGKQWRVMTDNQGSARIVLPAGTYHISVPGYKSYKIGFIPEEMKYGYIWTESATYSFGESTGISFWFYNENNLPPLPPLPPL